jgi:hypothetical protein
VCNDKKILFSAWLPEQVATDVSAQYDAPFDTGLNDYMPVIGKAAKFFGVNLTSQAMTAQIWQGSQEMNFNMSVVLQAERNAAIEVIKPIKDLLRLTMPDESEAGGLLTAPGPRVNLERLLESFKAKSPPTPVPQRSGESTQVGVSNPETNLFGGIADTIGGSVSKIPDILGGVINGTTDAIKGVVKRVPGSLTEAGKGMLNTTINAAVQVADFSKNVAGGALSQLNRTFVYAIDNNISLYIGRYLYFPSVVITDVNVTSQTLFDAIGNPMRVELALTFKTFYIPTQRDLEVMYPTSPSSESGVIDKAYSQSIPGLPPEM